LPIAFHSQGPWLMLRIIFWPECIIVSLNPSAKMLADLTEWSAVYHAANES